MPPVRFTIFLAALAALAACGRGEGGEAAREDTRSGAPALHPAIGPQPREALDDPRARIFLTKGCPQCHAISALRVASPTNTGPDLTTSAADVPSRFSTTLEEFLNNPVGTMQIVLSAQIQLSQAERDSIAKLLHALNPAN